MNVDTSKVIDMLSSQADDFTSNSKALDGDFAKTVWIKPEKDWAGNTSDIDSISKAFSRESLNKVVTDSLNGTPLTNGTYTLVSNCIAVMSAAEVAYRDRHRSVLQKRLDGLYRKKVLGAAKGPLLGLQTEYLLTLKKEAGSQ